MYNKNLCKVWKKNPLRSCLISLFLILVICLRKNPTFKYQNILSVSGKWLAYVELRFWASEQHAGCRQEWQDGARARAGCQPWMSCTEQLRDEAWTIFSCFCDQRVLAAQLLIPSNLHKGESWYLRKQLGTCWHPAWPVVFLRDQRLYMKKV